MWTLPLQRIGLLVPGTRLRLSFDEGTRFNVLVLPIIFGLRTQTVVDVDLVVLLKFERRPRPRLPSHRHPGLPSCPQAPFGNLVFRRLCVTLLALPSTSGNAPSWLLTHDLSHERRVL